ncbi:MAG: SAF domain-containing protein, partial [Candidatus Paceibacterota bacterium]
MSMNTAQQARDEVGASIKAPPDHNHFPLLRRRRRRWVLALCAALVAAGGLGTAFAFTSVNDTQEVLVVSNDIKRGETIEAGDLAVVRVSVDPALTPVPG